VHRGRAGRVRKAKIFICPYGANDTSNIYETRFIKAISRT